LQSELSNIRIIGVAVWLFFAILLGVGIHHMVSIGTCSSTGYSANYGPVPHCPAGTGWWFAFLFAGIFGCLAGAAMASNMGLVFAGIFGAIGVGALTLAFDSSAKSSTQVFGGVFGGVFALVGLVALVVVLSSAVRSLLSLRTSTTGEVRHGKTKTTTKGGPTRPTSPSATAMGVPTPAYTPSSSPTSATGASTLTPLNLLPGLQAAAKASASGDALDELSKLAELHQQGNLTDEEFASAKAKLLGQL
jgi:Short C-terminal domain